MVPLVLKKLLLLSLAALPLSQALAKATFDWFDYAAVGADDETPDGYFSNPVLPGFYPDPSITRRGDTYYLVNSSFAYTPGLPVFASKDLVNWHQIGNALQADSHIKFDGLGISRGIFAPTLRYHDGLFYLITTAVDSGGNFIMTASDPAGPWSKPVWLPEVEGIDPDLFIDEDGRAYIAHNDAPPGVPRYDGHRAVWMWELDLTTLKIKPDSRKLLVNGGVDIATHPVWIEGPHIYRIGDWYYLTCAEGGTSVNHSQVVFRTSSLDEPFVPYQHNPILTQRDRPDANVTSTGHADFIQTPTGQWWSVFLATRPYKGNHYNTGRETFLLPIHWHNGWPRILAAGEPVPLSVAIPNGATPSSTTFASRSRHFHDDFSGNALDPAWLGLNSFDRSWAASDKGGLTMTPISSSLTTPAQSAFLAKRQQHTHFDASTRLTELDQGTQAGLVVFQNRQFHYFLGVERDALQRRVFLEKVDNNVVSRVAEKVLQDTPEPLELRVSARSDKLQFSVTDATGENVLIGGQQPAELLSTETAGGFVGAVIGMHARKVKS